MKESPGRIQQNKWAVGAAYEEKAVEYLKNHGYFILRRNFRSRLGEIDIIAREGKVLVFIEVKYRRNLERGAPEEAVTPAKQRKICQMADYYRLQNGYGEETLCRFDVVAILGETVTLYRNAFPYVW